MIAVRGKRTYELSRSELERLISPFEDVLVDVGTGDGRFVLAHARAHPGTFTIGFDPVASAMESSSLSAARKRERGGTPNALFVVATAEDPPPELDGVADVVSIVLPWGRLLRAVLLGHRDVLGLLARIARPGARLRIVLNNEIFEDPVPLDTAELPEATVEYATTELKPLYAQVGIHLDGARFLNEDEVKRLRTTWARRLAHGRAPRFLELVGTVGADG
jgi:16S rRNA (adenine(1408)-N(1))-methyltransferase